MNLKKLLDAEAKGQVSTSIGLLRIFWLSVRDLSALDIRGSGAPEIDSKGLILRLIRFVCFPVDQLREGKYKPEAPVISAEQAGCLTDQDLQSFSREYLRLNENLFRSKTEKIIDSGGQRTVKIGLGDVVKPKLDSESDSDYLARLLREREIESEQQRVELMERFKKSFSTPLYEHVKEAQRLSESLRNSFENFRFDVPEFQKFERPTSADLELHVPAVESLRNSQSNFEKPFKKLDKTLRALLDQSSKAAELTIQYGNVQTEIAEELKSAADDGRRTATSNKRLTYFVILLTVVGLFFAGLQVWLAVAQRNDAIKSSDHQDRLLLSELKGIRHSLEDEDRALRNQVTSLEEELKRRELELGQLQRRIEKLEADRRKATRK